MPSLNEKQQQYFRSFIRRVTDEMNKKEDKSVTCYFCNLSKNFKTDLGAFFPIAPIADPDNVDKGLILDSVTAVWVCHPCMEQRKIQKLP